jgi:Na+/H+-translocating membrane pyrophosphatase
MIPYAFSAFTMKSVGKAAIEMVRKNYYFSVKKSNLSIKTKKQEKSNN